MKTLRFYGDSDDRREVDGDHPAEEYADVCKVSRTFVKDGLKVEEGLFVVFSYSEAIRNGCWMIGFQPIGEGEEIPEWAQDVKLALDDNGYSTSATLTVPDDVRLTWYDKHGEEVVG